MVVYALSPSDLPKAPEGVSEATGQAYPERLSRAG